MISRIVSIVIDQDFAYPKSFTAYISPIELTDSYKGLVQPLHFIKYIYQSFYLLYLILLILLIRYLSLLSTLTSRGESQIYLGRASNIGVVGRRTNVQYITKGVKTYLQILTVVSQKRGDLYSFRDGIIYYKLGKYKLVNPVILQI